MSTVDPDFTTTASSASNTHYALSISHYQLQIIYYSIGTLGMVGNFFVIYVITCSPNMHTKITNMYILNQSSADFLGGFFMVMTSLLQEPGQILQSLQDEVYCRLWLTKWEMWAMFVVSTYNLVLITVECYISVIHAIWHKTSFTKTKAIVSIIVVWIFWGCSTWAHTS